MKRLLAPFALSMLLLAGCATGPGVGGPGAGDPGTPPFGEGVDIRGEWTLTSVIQGDLDVSFNDIAPTMEFTNGNARVRTGCYSFNQTMTGDLDFVTIGHASLGHATLGHATMGYWQPLATCMALSDEQTQAIESLAGVVEAKRDGDALRLISETSVLRFELVPAVPLETILGTYRLSTVAFGDIGAGYDDGPTITFEADGTMSGSTGCNQFSGTLGEPVSGTNTLENLVMTEMGCDAPMNADVTAVLESGFLIHEFDGLLTLVSSTSETRLVYEPVS